MPRYQETIKAISVLDTLSTRHRVVTTNSLRATAAFISVLEGRSVTNYAFCEELWPTLTKFLQERVSPAKYVDTMNAVTHLYMISGGTAVAGGLNTTSTRFSTISKEMGLRVRLIELPKAAFVYDKAELEV